MMELSVGTGGEASHDLYDLVAALADNKYFLGLRYAEWCTAAPTLESAVAAASMAQDEIGHARSFYPLLRDVATGRHDPLQLEAETRTDWESARFLHESFQGWTDFVATNFLFDTSITVLLESAAESTFSPLGQRARRILEEEPLHWLHGEGWTRRLASHGGAVGDALTQSLEDVAPFSLALFDLATPVLVESRVFDRTPGQSQAIWRARVASVLDDAGLPRLRV